ncbi:hypothetical protein GGG87_05610 [Streptococcus sp. zg-86]|uniref:Uncharacterized protein n=1 Tax=Streptococcus zhangguiae TaxID=2664091 RepID=A0A6I4RTW0_9STRE|nr:MULTISPECIES: hypothetical protein [unclassified Streptococcus]MTB64465.1 hypothetical protein [Streptococcus sp. zg-86]MTB90845.1 hypothetical protein [Streptococcus sp. zg-36]MWV56452.1 hypothetical protein [Streptococcus sp. zg-70]QTH47341.1 hypothetical protein J5M87_07195 [Streptococcus sp. zg-86]
MKQWIVKVIVLPLVGMLTYHFVGRQFEGGFPWEVSASCLYIQSDELAVQETHETTKGG